MFGRVPGANTTCCPFDGPIPKIRLLAGLPQIRARRTSRQRLQQLYLTTLLYYLHIQFRRPQPF